MTFKYPWKKKSLFKIYALHQIRTILPLRVKETSENIESQDQRILVYKKIYFGDFLR